MQQQRQAQAARAQVQHVTRAAEQQDGQGWRRAEVAGRKVGGARRDAHREGGQDLGQGGEEEAAPKSLQKQQKQQTGF